MSGTTFSRTAVILIFAAALGSFALSMLLKGYGPASPASAPKAAPGTYSTSAVGYAGLLDVLNRLDRPVKRGLERPFAEVRSNGALVLAEPNFRHFPKESEIGLKTGQKRLLLVLPKWQWEIQPFRQEWVESVFLIPPDMAKRVLRLVEEDNEVVRVKWPAEWTVNELGFTPAGPDMVQLIKSPNLRPVVASKDGILVGELIDGSRRTLVLADPDLMNNKGLGLGDNAAFMVALVDNLRLWNNGDRAAPVVFDETVHGFSKGEWSPVKLLLDFPMVIVTLLVCAAGALLALSAYGRFGAPLKPKPHLDFGKTTLIDNSVRLLDYAGHHAAVLREYVRMTMRSAAQTLHAPYGLGERALIAWLDQVGQSRGVKRSCAAIMQAVADLNMADGDESRNLGRLYECARDIYRWKGEILNEPGARRRHR